MAKNSMSHSDLEKLIVSKGGYRIGKSVIMPLPKFIQQAYTCEKRGEVLVYDIGQGGPNYKARFSYDDFATEYLK
jgi:hypothetical protein